MEIERAVQVSVNPGEGLSVARGGSVVVYGRTVAEGAQDSQECLAEAIGTSVVCQLARFLAGRGRVPRVHALVSWSGGGEDEPLVRIGITAPGAPEELCEEMVAEARRAPALIALRARPVIWLNSAVPSASS